MKSDKSYIGQRAEAQAYLVWSDLGVPLSEWDASHGDGPDLQVSVHESGSLPAFLGVEVKGTVDLTQWLTLHHVLRRPMAERLRAEVSSLEYPVALTLVDVETLDTFVGWVKSPNELASPQHMPEGTGTIEMMQAERATLQAMVSEARRWYDSRWRYGGRA